MNNFAAQFGTTMGQLVAAYRAAFAWLAPLPHIATLVLLYLVFRYGQRYRKAFTIFFFLDYAWLVVFVGGWFSFQLFQRLGLKGLAMYGGTVLLILAVFWQWVQELRRPRLDLDFGRFYKWRLLISVPFFVWGFWYPPYEWGVRLLFDPRELLFGAYGLMSCPTTLVALAVLFLKYPEGNRPLFHVLTAYAVIVGAAMVALRYVPDIPFFLFGLVCLASIVRAKIRERRLLGQAPAHH